MDKNTLVSIDGEEFELECDIDEMLAAAEAERAEKLKELEAELEVEWDTEEPVVDIDKQYEEWLQNSEPEKNKIENITFINDKDKWLEEWLKELEKSDELLKKLDQTRNQSSNKPQKVYYYDHLGKKFESYEEMCEFHNIPYEIYIKRIECGWTRYNAISTPVKMDEREECEDHLGNKFPFLLSMCMHWHIKQRHYKNRIAAGWTVESALTTPVDPYKPIVDHIGNEFSSIDKFCTYWKISFYKYYDIVDNHQLFKDYLIPVPCKDHLGNEFPHDKAMCEYWEISRELYIRRLYVSGWSLEEALTVPVGQRPYVCKDHEGNRFNSISEMCKRWNIPFYVYKKRKKKGWPLFHALTTPPSQREIGYVDHTGKHFETQKEMLKYWNVSECDYRKRVADGCDMRTALLGEQTGSSIEMQVDKYLSSKNMKFTREYSQHGCIFSDTNHRARFDFHIPEVGIIEVDGEQHFKPVEIWGGEEHLKKNQDHDTLKTKYCEENNIPLLRIRYDQLKNDVYKSMIDDFLANPDKYIKNHNTYMTEEEYYGAA